MVTFDGYGYDLGADFLTVSLVISDSGADPWTGRLDWHRFEVPVSDDPTDELRAALDRLTGLLGQYVSRTYGPPTPR
jgi:hypothetical protein